MRSSVMDRNHFNSSDVCITTAFVLRTPHSSLFHLHGKQLLTRSYPLNFQSGSGAEVTVLGFPSSGIAPLFSIHCYRTASKYHLLLSSTALGTTWSRSLLSLRNWDRCGPGHLPRRSTASWTCRIFLFHFHIGYCILSDLCRESSLFVGVASH